MTTLDIYPLHIATFIIITFIIFILWSIYLVIDYKKFNKLGIKTKNDVCIGDDGNVLPFLLLGLIGSFFWPILIYILPIILALSIICGFIYSVYKLIVTILEK